jgi:hypothetical protein
MMNGRISRRLSGICGIVVSYSAFESYRGNCEEKINQSSSINWYPGKYMSSLYTSFMYTEDDLHFMRYQSSLDYRGLMSWPSMEKGLQLRIEDEAMLQKLLSELQSSKENKADLIPLYTRKIEDILYGSGLTAKDRQEHLLKYGCAAYTDQALQLIADSVKKMKYKGIIEIGAG